MADTLTIRPMVDADLPAVLDTLRASLGETPLLKRTPEQWRWKHTDNPFGRSIVVLALAGDRVAGVRAFMRWHLTTPVGSHLSCVRAVDTAVHPDFQRRGVFSRLNDVALDMARDDGVDLVFNTPNPKSRAGYLKQGWRDVGPIGVMVRPSLRLAQRRRPDGEMPEPSELVPNAVQAVGLDGTDRPPLGLRTVRSAAYRAWRFAEHPTAPYVRIDAGGSTAVLRVNRRNGRDELVVSELIGDDGSAALKDAAAQSQAAYMVTWFSAGTPERAKALRSGFVPVPKVTALSLVARPLRELHVDVFDAEKWDLALSDLELL